MACPSPLRLAFLMLAGATLGLAQAPSTDRIIRVDELRAGMKGTVWTVFTGTEPEPFSVEVVGVSKQGLGPGRAMIICKLTDPRVQRSGAAAGMSGSPLYIDGRWAGALSYQVQRFETVRHAGFTPAEDILSVALAPAKGDTPSIQSPDTSKRGATPLGLAYSLTGVSAEAAGLFAREYAELGIDLGQAPLAGASGGDAAVPPARLAPGSPVAVVLAHGDITLGGTGTVTHVDGDNLFAFGHPMMSLGAVEIPLASAEVVTILPSLQSSFKLANIGQMVGTLRQDRLSSIFGQMGPVPVLLPVTVKTPERTLHFGVIQEPRLAPLLIATGAMQGVSASNAQGGAEGYIVRSTFDYGDGEPLTWENWFPGSGGMQAGASLLAGRLGVPFSSPFRGFLPQAVNVEVIRLGQNPDAALDTVQASATSLGAGDVLSVSLQARQQGNEIVEAVVQTTVPAEWAGQKTELGVVSGALLARLVGQPENVSVNQVRNLSALKDLLRQPYRDDGAYVVVLERVTALVDEVSNAIEPPGSIERIARRADDARFQRREVYVPLWIEHVFPGLILDASFRRPLQITD